MIREYTHGVLELGVELNLDFSHTPPTKRMVYDFKRYGYDSALKYSLS